MTTQGHRRSANSFELAVTLELMARQLKQNPRILSFRSWGEEVRQAGEEATKAERATHHPRVSPC